MPRKLLVSAALLLFVLPTALARTPPASATTPVVDTSKPLKVGGSVLPPVVIHSAEPKFKRIFFRKPKPGVVVVGLTVSAAGIPTGVHIVQSSGTYYDKSAITAVEQYRFRPATQYGRPVPVELKIRINFDVF
jgi:protein TonB